MSGNKQKIKSRIRSIQSTSKITGAMELIANAKLTQLKKKALDKDSFNQGLIYISNLILNNFKEDNIYLNVDNSKPKCYIVFCSDMGLCGGYNNNILKMVKDNASLDSTLLVIGKKEYNHIKALGYNIINDVITSDDLQYGQIVNLANQVLQLYQQGSIGSINVIYTKFINTLTFQPTCLTLLPLEIENVESNDNKQYDFEPDGITLLNQVIPMMLQANINYYYLQSKTSEYGARRAAMQQSNDNASELINDLTLQYNQARQAAITQEITEIVSGADAI